MSWPILWHSYSRSPQIYLRDKVGNTRVIKSLRMLEMLLAPSWATRNVKIGAHFSALLLIKCRQYTKLL